ncbi:MAG: hypothetical protein ACP5NF_08055 [Thermoanaerobaculum sp.]
MERRQARASGVCWVWGREELSPLDGDLSQAPTAAWPMSARRSQALKTGGKP